MTENERVRIIRKDKNLTMEEFGKRLGVSKVAISNIENGNRNVTNQMRQSIINQFDVNETWFRTGDESNGRYIQKTEEDELSDLFAEIMSAPADDSIRALARAFGCRDLQLGVYPQNDAAVAFYQKCGFTIRSIDMQRKV